jgi:geranylgeranyl diphosphate synthase type II
MTDRLVNFIAAHGQAVEAALVMWLPLSKPAGAERLNEALRYAVFPGGKRLRPMLTIIGTKLVGGEVQKALPAACAVEFLHTSSLILDDLPAMDDADLRRGRPAVHLACGEGIATLAALALFNQAYALLARAAGQSGEPALTEKLLAEAAHCIGADGMIGGQAVDLALRAAGAGPEVLGSRNLKTTALMRLTMTAGAIGCGANDADVSALAKFGEFLGLTYQICDDLLDEVGECGLTGKPARQDARHLRPTFVGELGLEGSHRLAMLLAEEGKAAITDRFGHCHEALLLVEALHLVVRDVVQLRPAEH